MRELDTKEKITKNRCRYDAKLNITISLKAAIMGIVVLSVMAVVLNFSDYFSDYSYFNIIFGIIVIAMVGAFLAWCTIDNLVFRNRIKKYKFFIVEDVVLNKREQHPYPRTRRRIRHYLEFDRCTEFLTPSKNYVWSDYSKVNDFDIFNATNVGDKFYVVVPLSQRNKEVWTPLAVYNTKYFELSEKSFVHGSQDWFVKAE